MAIASAAAFASEDPFPGDSGSEYRRLADSEYTLTETIITGGAPDLPFRDTAVTTYEPPCAEWADASGDGSGGGVAPLSVDEADRLAAESAAREQELLDASVAASASDHLTPITQDKDRTAPPAPEADAKPVKSPANRFRLQGDPVDTAAVNDLWATIRQAEADIAADLADLSDLSGGDPDCLMPHRCSGERVQS